MTSECSKVKIVEAKREFYNNSLGVIGIVSLQTNVIFCKVKLAIIFSKTPPFFLSKLKNKINKYIALRDIFRTSHH